MLGYRTPPWAGSPLIVIALLLCRQDERLWSSNRETRHEKDKHHWSIDGRGNSMRNSYLA
jgi:hypothetical protein